MSRTTNRKPSEVIFGYELKERIGSGGYGEVWAAEAPGGLQKAVKFIYGFHEEDRAQREMKSLNHIKMVRHPFLLSLERIDVVDGQLTIITELAEMSLKDRFDECIREGKRGIPRDELLRYIKESAEALDYINHQHSLQHLDIKPENILLVSGHVKVADFGLVKEIHDATASLMGGLTPLYAPPELFDGRPSRNSDQYSLAIVYQEMLTGSRPFDGDTAAQMAAQHLRGRPKLSKLPRSDRSVIATALAKDPNGRHPDCQTLVKRLYANPLSEVSIDAGPHKPGSTDTEHEDIRPFSGTGTQLCTKPLRQQPVQVHTLPPIDHDPQNSFFRPTLIVGLGRTGTRILQDVRCRLSEYAGSRDELPGIRMLAIDPDVHQLRQACHDANVDRVLLPSEILETPLSTREEYRERSKVHLTWLSRRWLYNLPRSRMTEGIRPLGRLAFADHIETIRRRLTDLLSDLTDRNGTRTTAAKLGLRGTDAGPRVIIVASAAGGFGSGCTLDLAYLVRHLMAQVGVPDDALLGMLTHATPRSHSQERELMIANTYAFLSEFYHYCRLGYPGDEACALPEMDSPQGAFSTAYLFDLGGDLPSHEYDRALCEIGEYVYLSTASPVATLLDRCRIPIRDSQLFGPQAEQAVPEGTDGMYLSTIGLKSIGGSSGELTWQTTNRIADQLLHQWIEQAPAHGGDYDPKAEWKNAIAESQLSEHDLLAAIQQMAATELQLPPEHEPWFAETAQRHIANMNPRHGGPQWEAVLDALDRTVALDPPAAPNSLRPLTKKKPTAIETWMTSHTQQITQRLEEILTHLVDSPHHRFAAAQRMVEHALLHLNDLADQLRLRQEELARKMNELRGTILNPSHDSSKSPEPILPGLVSSYLRLRFLDTILKLGRATLGEALRRMGELVAHFKQVLHQLSRVRERMQDVVVDEDAEPTGPLDSLMRDSLEEQLPQLLEKLNRRCDGAFWDDGTPLSEPIFRDPTRGVHRVEARLLQLAQEVTREALRSSNMGERLLRLLATEASCRTELDSRIREATPPLLIHGGAKRTIAVASDPACESGIRDVAQTDSEHPVTMMTCPGGNVVFLCEVCRIPLANVAMSLLANRPDSVVFASRLKTRIDIEWSALTDLL